MTVIVGLGFFAFAMTLYLVYDDGPFDVFKWLRFFAGVNILSQPIEIDGNPISAKDAMIRGLDVELECNESITAKLISCHRCTGFWVALFIALPHSITSQSIMTLLGVIGINIFLHEILDMMRSLVSAIDGTGIILADVVEEEE